LTRQQQTRARHEVRLRRLIGAAAFLSACAGHATTGAVPADDSLLQRMLVAEDARGTGREGVAPLLEGQKSSDSTMRFVASRALQRLKWTPTPAPPPSTRPPRTPAQPASTGPCARLIARAHSNDLRVRIPTADSLTNCADDGTTLLALAHSADDNIRAGAITGLSRTAGHASDTVFISALSAHGYQVVLAAANALKGSPMGARAVPALLASLDRVTAERRENARDERVALLARVADFGSATDTTRLRPYTTDFDTTIAAKSAALLSTWTATTVVPHARPLAIRPEPLARIFRTRNMQLRIAMAPASGGGVILINLFTDETPATIARVTRLARAHYYDGLSFHRYVPHFVIQGGSPGANEQIGDAQFMRDELGGHSHLRGTVGISTRGHDTGDAQFFINLVDNKRLDHDYTVFGEVVSGMDVVDKIRAGDIMQRVDVISGAAKP
jgi:cyclophilin family peptidyl-prolyl cis-trans isomerase